MILFKTGNVLSANSIFDVDNIEIVEKDYQSNEELLNSAFKKAFNKMMNRILLKQDISKISKINLNNIKELVSYYQIINNKNINNSVSKNINISFEREKVNNFFYKNNISYADITDSKIVIFPVFINEENFYVYSENYFYTNWNINKKSKKNEL